MLAHVRRSDSAVLCGQETGVAGPSGPRCRVPGGAATTVGWPYEGEVSAPSVAIRMICGRVQAPRNFASPPRFAEQKDRRLGLMLVPLTCSASPPTNVLDRQRVKLLTGLGVCPAMAGRTQNHEIAHKALALSEDQRRQMMCIEHGALLVLEPARFALEVHPPCRRLFSLIASSAWRDLRSTFCCLVQYRRPSLRVCTSDSSLWTTLILISPLSRRRFTFADPPILPRVACRPDIRPSATRVTPGMEAIPRAASYARYIVTSLRRRRPPST